MNPTIQIAPDFEVLYPTSSARATECAMNLVLTADLLVKRIAQLLQPLHLTPASGLVLSILADSESSLPPFRPIVHQHQKEWFEVLSETEQQQLIVALHRLQESLQDTN